MATMGFEMVGTTMVIVYGASAPSDADYERCLEHLERNMATITGALVYSLGGGPAKSTQRQRAARLWQASKLRPKVAVLTDSPLVRGMFTALAWVMSEQIRSFRSVDTPLAAEYLGAPHLAMYDAIGRLSRRLDAPVASAG